MNLNQNSRKEYILILLFLFIILALLPAQSNFLDMEQIGMGTDLGLTFTGAGFERVGSRTVYSVNGLVDLGLDLGVVASTVEGANTLEYQGALAWGVTLIKQGHLIPVTIFLSGSFSRMITMSDFLETSNLLMTGTGYSLGSDVFRYIFAAHRLYLRLGASFLHESVTYVKEKEPGSFDSIYPVAHSEYGNYLGLIAGLSYRPNRANRGIAVSVDLRTYLDSGLAFKICPVLSFSLVENKIAVR